MAKLNRETEIQALVDNVEEVIKKGEFEPVEKKQISWEKIPIVSTRSTLLDLAISGGRRKEGGLPCCILVEVHGPAGSGKSALLSTIGADAQEKGGESQLQDPESRVDKEYARIYEIELDKTNYHRPETVSQVFHFIEEEWKTEKQPKVLLTDSIAALTTELEQETGDKMGMRRAKEFSAGFRKNARIISNMLWMCSNQERESDTGIVTTGGKAVAYYASVRIRVQQKNKVSIKKKNKYDVEIERIIGIKSECFVEKSTVDDPYRSAPLYIIFGRGIDDVRANLQYLKEMQKLTSYMCPDGKSFMGMEQAILHVEEKDLVKDLKNLTIEMWHEIEELFKANRNRSRK
jgi:RecA/RadA recombinase